LLRNHSDVLVLVYEDMVEDLRSQLPRIARFMGISTPLDEKLMQRVLESSSKEAMLREVSKYSDHWLPKRMAEVGRHMGWKISDVAAKVIKNRKGYSVVTPVLRAAVEGDFRKKMEEIFDGRFRGYNDLKNVIRKAYE